MGHILRRYRKGSRFHGRQHQAVEPLAHAKRPNPFHNCNVFVYRMSVGKCDVACILMNSKNKRLTRFGEIARHLLDPLPWLKFAERVNAVRGGMILRFRIVPRERER